MVFSVCHGSLGNIHDAEDAFQATFVVLARKAGSLRKPELLGPWLHGVARRTVRRLKEKNTRRRRDEAEAAMSGKIPECGTLNNGPERSRSPMRSTYSTRRSSDCPSGTEWQSSSATWKASRMRRPHGGWDDASARSAPRLSRGRERLRGRLSRRGLALPAGIIGTAALTSSAKAMPAALVASTARIAMISSAGLTSGVVPASIASLSDGVLKSMLFARLKLISATALLFGAAATGGVILAQQGEQPPKARAEPSAAVWTIKGTVIDELGRAVAGATIQRQPSESPSSEDKTAADGTFTLNVGGERSFTRGVAAITEAEAKIGLVRFGEVPDLEAIGAMTITVKPSQAVRVRVRDAGGNPVPGAAVESIDFSYRSRAETDPDGVAILHLPANGRVQWVIGLKSGVGFDYFENYQSKPATDFPPLPGELKLTLDGAWAFRLKALDSRGQPVPGVVFSPWMLKKNGKIDSANVGGSIAVRATADHAGTATFDWLPKELGSVNFVARPGTYTSPEPPLLIRSATTEATIRLDRNTRLSGTVRYPDGRPAPTCWFVSRANGLVREHHSWRHEPARMGATTSMSHPAGST